MTACTCGEVDPNHPGWTHSLNGTTIHCFDGKPCYEDLHRSGHPIEEPGKADWLWDDDPLEEFGQYHVPCCRARKPDGRKCGNGPLSYSEIAEGICWECAHA